MHLMNHMPYLFYLPTFVPVGTNKLFCIGNGAFKWKKLPGCGLLPLKDLMKPPATDGGRIAFKVIISFPLWVQLVVSFHYNE
jgi:hypothetical protein